MKHLKLGVLLIGLCIGQTLVAQNLSENIVSAFEQSRYVHIYQKPVISYHMGNSKSGEDVVMTPKALQIHFDMGYKNFEFEHGRYLTFYINKIPVIEYDPDIEGDYESQLKYAPLFSNIHIVIECPTESEIRINETFDLWTRHHLKTYSDGREDYTNMIFSMTNNLNFLEKHGCKMFSKTLSNK